MGMIEFLIVSLIISLCILFPREEESNIMKFDEDKLLTMWKQQHEFMLLLQKKRNFPKFPVDIKSREGQKFLKNIAYECMDELFEANKELKNSKSHRITEISALDRSAYIEELVDAQHFLFEIVIASGISIDEFYDSYISKGDKNTTRIESGY